MSALPSAWQRVAAGLLAAALCNAQGQAPPAAQLGLVVTWTTAAPAAQVEVAWINQGPIALAIWPMTDTDAGLQHDALRAEHAAWSAALIAPRKHAAARWCWLAPGQRYGVTIDLADWQRRLLAADPPRSGWRLVYAVAPGSSAAPAPLPACVAGTSAPPAAPGWVVWVGRLPASIQAADAASGHGKRISRARPSAGPAGSRPPVPRPG